MPKKKIRVKVSTNETKAMDELFNELEDALTKSGAIDEDARVRTGVEDNGRDSKGISTEDYIKLMEELGGVSDGSHIEDAEERQKYLEDLTEEQKANVIEKDRILTVRGSDETTDSYGDIVRVAGWDLKRYKKNPVLLAFHDSRQFPCGKALKVWKENNDPKAPNNKSLMFNLYFPKSNEWSDFVYQQFKDGLLNAFSVGFKAIKANNPSSVEERNKIGLGKWGIEFLKQELTELSAVPVPANSNCVVVKSEGQAERARNLGMEVEMKDSSLDTVEVPKDTLEDLTSLVKELRQEVKELKDVIDTMEITVNIEEKEAEASFSSEKTDGTETKTGLYEGLLDIAKSIKSK